MAMVGMDIEQIRSIGNSLKSQAGQIETVVSTINGLVSQISGGAWQGSDATEFISWWETQHKPALDAAKQAIDGLGQSALNNAAQQEQVSQV